MGFTFKTMISALLAVCTITGQSTSALANEPEPGSEIPTEETEQIFSESGLNEEESGLTQVLPDWAKDWTKADANRYYDECMTAYMSAAEPYNKGIKGFFESNRDNGSASNAKAFQVLERVNYYAEELGTLSEDDGNLSFTESMYPSMGDEYDATNLEKVKDAINNLKTLNQFRAEQEQPEIMVSDFSMAVAEVQANLEYGFKADTGQLMQFVTFQNEYDVTSEKTVMANNASSGYDASANFTVAGTGIRGDAENALAATDYWTANLDDQTLYKVSEYETLFNSYADPIISDYKTAQDNMTIAAQILFEFTYTKVTGITLDKNTITLAPGTTGSVRVIFTPADAANKNVTWTSSNTEVATVAASLDDELRHIGLITAGKEGTAVLTVKTEDGGFTAKCTVVVGSGTNHVSNGDNLANEIANSDSNTVEVDCNTNTSVPSDVFSTIKGTDKTVTFTNGSAQWTFSGKDITGNDMKTVDVSTTIAPAGAKDSAITQLSEVKDSVPVVVTFASNGTLPGKATVKVALPDTVRSNLGGKTISVYYFNEKTNKLEPIAEGLIADANGNVAFPITHCSKYVIAIKNKTTPATPTPAPVTPTPAPVTPTPAPVDPSEP